MRSNSADAAPQTSVPVPARALLATKLKPGSVQVPDSHVNGPSVAWRLVPAKRRAAPWTMNPCTARPEAGAPVGLLTLAIAVPSRPPMSKVDGDRDTPASCAVSAQPMLLKQQVKPPNPLWLMAAAPNSGRGITSRPIGFTRSITRRLPRPHPPNDGRGNTTRPIAYTRSIPPRLPSPNPPPDGKDGHAPISVAGA